MVLLEVLRFHSDITAAVRDDLDQMGGFKTEINIRISCNVLLEVYTQSLQSFWMERLLLFCIVCVLFFLQDLCI